ncbi:TolC family protein [Granulicella cerasi]|uniref:TolC family protein n=1 Tax=Granulicella cerasi TaxID=741063 RepID=A0ABW1Z8R0_9BACT|nr:TolC family protein [Granulicella cerasi]
MKQISATSAFLALAIAAPLTTVGCKVGPQYHPPAAVMAPTNSYKEAPPTNHGEGWSAAAPADAQLKGDWWTMFSDPQLNEFEPQVDAANQSLKSAEANFRAARAYVGTARSYEAPTIGVAPVFGAIRDSANQPYFNRTLANNGVGNFQMPVDLSWELDVWGRVRRGVTQARENAQAAFSDAENARLSLHAELALDYFTLRSDDAQLRLYDDTIQAYQRAVDLTQTRFEGGVAPQSDVTQARTQLEAARVQRTELTIERANMEHAIAVLTGKAPASFSIAPLVVTPPIQNVEAGHAIPAQIPEPHVPSPSMNSAAAAIGPVLPSIPGVLPSDLLQRRPDIAASERRVGAANEAIGIAQAAYYPQFSLSAVGGFAGTSMLNWFTWPSRFFSVGPMASETIFDFGRRRSTKQMTEAQYDEAVANYRQTALTAFQQVEDSLASLSALEKEAAQQRAATESAERSLQLFNDRYEGGVDNYLQVITWQTQALVNERNELLIQQRRLQASVLLIKALGGGWNVSTVPHL